MRSSQNTPADIRGFLSIDEQMIGDDVYTILINKGGLAALVDVVVLPIGVW